MICLWGTECADSTDRIEDLPSEFMFKINNNQILRLLSQRSVFSNTDFFFAASILWYTFILL